ncbi:VirB4 family type IV secretion/conjugal transfer ATPase [Metapseudomonas furukawaii]|uniref:Conjugative transfer protein n=1 Tax=Metapseudomonas furukawaii TaxID=1149133 RepID=A0AAD1C4K3_METFU|nr:Conjugative transfer protein TrbE [Pseudomonas furukawaii]ELS26294.1 Conjugative transfer protein TrbE [Pseudomonas furukawaii]BAU77404.1 conjugative transfer protein [Pseudomonas furukawaii]
MSLLLPRPSSIKPFRSRKPGFSDLLQYAAMPEDGVVTLKYGAYLVSWIYQGEDNASATDTQREIVSAVINRELLKLGSGWMLHTDAIRRPAPKYADEGASAFPDPVTKAIDQERRQTFERLGAMYEGAFIMSVTYQPPLALETKFIDMMFDDDAEIPDEKARYAKQTADFMSKIKSLEDNLSTVLKMERLRGHRVLQEDGSEVIEDDLLAYLNYCITGNQHPIVLPSCAMYLDSLLGGQEFWAGVVPKIGRRFIQTVAISGLPTQSVPGILTELGELPCEYRWSTRFIFMDQHEAQSQFDKFRRKWKQKVRGFMDQLLNKQNGAVDEDALSMVADATGAKAEINSRTVAYGFYTSVVVLMSEDRAEVEESAARIAKMINGRGFAARVETLNTVEAWLGSLPGHGVENIRRPLISTLNLADLMPTSSIWTGSNIAPCPFYRPNSPALMQCATSGNTPFWLNLHVRDLGHTLIFGPPGSGKSVLLALIQAQFRRYENASIYAFDKGMSAYALCKGAGGAHYAVAGDNSPSFAPLADLSSPTDLAWAAEWVDDCLKLQGLVTTPNQRNEIARALTNMRDTESRTVTDLVSTLQDVQMRAALHVYTLDGPMGHLLDAERDSLSVNSFNVFEIEELMSLGDRYVLPVLSYLFRRIEKSLKGQPAMIVLDEAWLMLAHPAFKEKIVEWLKVLRKANCIVVMATQSLSDAVKSGILDVLKEAAPTKIYLANGEARDEETAAIYRKLGLNARQIEIVARATPKRHYYYVSEQGRRVFDLALGPLSLAFVGVSDKEAVAKVKALEATYGADWTHHWLADRGLRLSDYVRAA